MKLIFYFLLFFLAYKLYPQEISIDISNSLRIGELIKLEGDRKFNIDTIFAIEGVFEYRSSKLEVGLYLLQLDDQHWLNFINDGKDIELKTDYNNIIDSLKIIKSESNKLYYKFLKLNKDYKTKTELLTVILTHYTNDDEYYEITKEKLRKIKIISVGHFLDITDIKKADFRL